MIAMPNDRPSKPKRCMRAPVILLSLLILSLTACSTNRQGLRSSLDFIRPAQQLPIGTFVGPTTGAVIKLRLELDGNYIVEDIGPPEFWMMAEGNKFYPQRIKFPSERGRWALDNRTGQLTLIPDTAALDRWGTKHLRYDKATPDRLALGNNAFLVRADE
jgi:hypothetical protein